MNKFFTLSFWTNDLKGLCAHFLGGQILAIIFFCLYSFLGMNNILLFPFSIATSIILGVLFEVLQAKIKGERWAGIADSIKDILMDSLGAFSILLLDLFF
ncbi:MAG TPA: hypothetical protein ENH82_05080 [bacterium]|nr:hypothetical protein [bacterium]